MIPLERYPSVSPDTKLDEAIALMEQAKRPVSDVMRPIEVVLDYDDHIIKGVYEMVGYGLTLLPILKDGQVVGVIRTVELFRELANIVLSAK